MPDNGSGLLGKDGKCPVTGRSRTALFEKPVEQGMAEKALTAGKLHQIRPAISPVKLPEIKFPGLDYTGKLFKISITAL